MIKLGELVMMLDLHHQGLSNRQRVAAAGLQKAGTKAGHRRSLRCANDWLPIPPAQPCGCRVSSRNAASLAATASYAIACANCDLPGRRVPKCVLKRQRVSRRKATSPGSRMEFVDEPGVKRIIWLFSIVLG